MQKFTQKWSLITLLEPKDEGYEFFWKDCPLHVTLAGVIAVDWETTELYEKLAALLAKQKSIELKAEEETNWGENKEILVMKLSKTPEMATLHNSIVKVLESSGAVFNEPQYEGDGYIPHSTVQKHARLKVGDKVKIDSLTIVDMFPNGDGYKRKLLRTIKFTG